MAPLSVARALVEMWTGQSLDLTSHGNPVMMCYPDFVPVATSDPLPQAPLVTESGFSQAASMQPNTGLHAEIHVPVAWHTAQAITVEVLHALASFWQGIRCIILCSLSILVSMRGLPDHCCTVQHIG